MIADKGDILVTTPISQSADAAREAEKIKRWGGGYYLRSLGRNRPRKSHSGNRCFYVDRGFIRGFAIIEKFRIHTDDPTRPIYEAVMDARSWVWIKPIERKGFQGFRYVEGMEFEPVGNWLDPMPKAAKQIDGQIARI